MDVGILDIETSSKPRLHPWMKGAFISTIGLRMYLQHGGTYYKEWVWRHRERSGITSDDRLNIIYELQDEVDKLRGNGLLVGHNVKFDLNWMKWFNLNVTGIKLWDTMVVDYMLNGQVKIGYDLSECCTRHGLPVKTDVVKSYWDAGRETDTIPLSILLPYQKNDVDITADLFKAQYRIVAKDKAFHTLVDVRNQVLHSVTDIECNGMPFDRKSAEKHVKYFSADLETTESELKSYFGRSDINMGSGPELSACLFGGNLKRTKHVPLVYTRNATLKEPYQLTYKSGKQKGMTVTKYKNRTVLELTCKKRKEDYEVPLKGVGFIPGKGTETKVEGVYQTNKDVLKNLVCNTKGGTSVKHKRKVLDLLRHRSKIAQFTGTLAGGNEDTGLLYRASLNDDGWLHAQYNQAIAATGRFTSSGPNGQNFTRAGEDEDGFSNPLKSCFVPSRFGGYILAVDLSQVEWRIAVWLSQDPVGMKEIFDGVDIHADNAIKQFGDIKYRQAAKIMTFRLLYGGSAYAFFMDPAMPNFTLKQWIAIVDAYERKYRVLHEWQRRNISTVGMNEGWLQGPLGRRWLFPKTPIKKLKGILGFDPRKIKNFPVQGTSADVMMVAMNMMQARMDAKPTLYASTNWLGQVHDSMLFDTMPHEVKRVAHTGIQVFEDLPVVISDMWDVDFNLPLTGEATWGPDYADQCHSVEHKGGQWVMT